MERRTRNGPTQRILIIEMMRAAHIGPSSARFGAKSLLAMQSRTAMSVVGREHAAERSTCHVASTSRPTRHGLGRDAARASLAPLRGPEVRDVMTRSRRAASTDLRSTSHVASTSRPTRHGGRDRHAGRRSLGFGAPEVRDAMGRNRNEFRVGSVRRDGASGTRSGCSLAAHHPPRRDAAAA